MYPESVTEMLRSARAQNSGEKCRSQLRSAIKLCDEWIGETENIEGEILKAQIYSELAIEENDPERRTFSWRRVIRILSKNAIVENSRGAIAQGFLYVDCFQDILSTIEVPEKSDLLRRAIKFIDHAFKNGSAADKPQLLARKSSVLRHLALLDHGPEVRVNRLKESQRCADLAAKDLNSPDVLLELGLSEWALSRHEQSDESHVKRLRRVEQILTSSEVQSLETGQIALARLYRFTYRPMESCDCYKNKLTSQRNTRRALRESYIYAEAATQLWFSKYPDEIVQPHLLEAKAIVERAIASGYRNARLITSLAFLVAALEGAAAADITFREIVEKGTTNWREAVRMVSRSGNLDLLSEGFALGINQSAVWTRLGTFAWIFLDDIEFSEELYRIAVRLDPHDPIALTNLARLLVKKASEESLADARRFLQKAQNLADRRFIWWRIIFDEIRNKTPAPNTQASSTGPLNFRKRRHSKNAAIGDLSEIRNRFISLANSDDAQHRGYQLEFLIYQVAALTFGVAAPAYRMSHGESNPIKQVDAYFEHNQDRYRVECKWTADLTLPSDIVLFANKLDAVGVSGLFISMSGFTKQAISQAQEFKSSKAIILMDGEEIDLIFNGHASLDQVMNRKRLHFNMYSAAYNKIEMIGQVI